MLKLLRIRKCILFFRERRWATFFSSQAPGSPFMDSMKADGPGLLLSLCDFCWVNISQFWQMAIWSLTLRMVVVISEKGWGRGLTLGHFMV